MLLQRHLRVIDCTDQGFEARAIRVAFASSDRLTIDQHFGSAVVLLVYGIDAKESRLLEVVQFGDQQQDGNEQKLVAKLEALQGCVAVYSQAVGASAVIQLKARQIQPMKVPPGTLITELVSGLQQQLASEPSSWLAQALRQQNPSDPQRFDAMDDEGWQE